MAVVCPSRVRARTADKGAHSLLAIVCRLAHTRARIGRKFRTTERRRAGAADPLIPASLARTCRQVPERAEFAVHRRSCWAVITSPVLLGGCHFSTWRENSVRDGPRVGGAPALRYLPRPPRGRLAPRYAQRARVRPPLVNEQ